MRDLRPLFEPRSVAIVGASNDSAKWGHWLARNAVKGSAQAVFLVNRNGGEILGRRAYRSLDELPEAASSSSSRFRLLASPTLSRRPSNGARAGSSASPRGWGRRARKDAPTRARSSSGCAPPARCSSAQLHGADRRRTELELSTNDMPSGSIGLVSQSGNVAIEVGLLAAEAGVGFSRFVSIGNRQT